MLRRISIMVLVAIILVTVGLSGCSKKDQSTSSDEDTNIVDSNENNTGDETPKEEDINSEDNQQQEDQGREDNQEDENKENENIVYISASKLNVRSKASVDGKKIGAVIKAAVKILTSSQMKQEKLSG